MSFQRLAVSEGVFLARDSTLLPALDEEAVECSSIHTPRVSGVGYRASEIPPTSLSLFVHLALCHTVRVEEDPEAALERKRKTGRSGGVEGEGKGSSWGRVDALGRRMQARLRRMRRSGRKGTAPSRDWTCKRRESAVSSAMEAVADVQRGDRINTGDDYEYQVRHFDGLHNWDPKRSLDYIKKG